jgi:hypothetical protein
VLSGFGSCPIVFTPRAALISLVAYADNHPGLVCFVAIPFLQNYYALEIA